MSWELVLFVVAIIPLVIVTLFALVEVMQRDDLNGVRRAGWVVALLLLPGIGLAGYAIARPYAGAAFGDSDHHDPRLEEIVRTADSHHRGDLSDDEYARTIERLTKQ